MALGAHDALGARLERTLVIAKDGHLEARRAICPGSSSSKAATPCPMSARCAPASVCASSRRHAGADVMPVFLISGGASSLAEVLAPGATLQDLRQLNATGLASGEDIAELNARRRRISTLKGGGLTAACGPRGARAVRIGCARR